MAEGLPDDWVDLAVRINMLDLENEYARVAADYAYVVPLYAQTVADEHMAKTNVDAVKGLMSTELRAQIKAQEGKFPTEARLKSEVDADAAVMQAHQHHAAAQRRKAYLRGVLDAIAKKENMLVSLGATQRQERQVAGRAV